jgi:hypothetical protein
MVVVFVRGLGLGLGGQHGDIVAPWGGLTVSGLTRGEGILART